MGGTDFNGFPEAGISFLQGLQENNNKAWFEAHRTEYEEYLLEPARAFASEMADRLSALTSEPVEGKLFRIYRDVRFSKDKRPYKNHIGVAFGEAGREKGETPGFYFHLEPPTVMLGGGLHEFPKDFLEAYREVLADPVRAATARGLTETLACDGYELWGKTYKRVPKGFDAGGSECRSSVAWRAFRGHHGTDTGRGAFIGILGPLREASQTGSAARDLARRSNRGTLTRWS